VTRQLNERPRNTLDYEIPAERFTAFVASISCIDGKFRTFQKKCREMKIWVDADACPSVIKDILFRAADRTGVQLILVANQALRIPPSRYIKFLKVTSGFDVADNEIIKMLNAGDLVVTSDIPLAAEVIEKRAHALSPRGELYSADNIRARLTMRDFMDTLRASGIETGGPPTLSHRDRKSFANHLDQLLAKYAGTA